MSINLQCAEVNSPSTSIFKYEPPSGTLPKFLDELKEAMFAQGVFRHIFNNVIV